MFGGEQFGRGVRGRSYIMVGGGLGGGVRRRGLGEESGGGGWRRSHAQENLGELEVLLWFMNIVKGVHCTLGDEYDYGKTTITLADWRVLKGAC